MSKSRKVNVTKDYRLFHRSDDNRVLNLKKHRKLEQSMKKYGFLPCYPIVCYRDKDGKLVVKDGQHRLAIAESLGLAVHWIEESIDFDVAEINTTPKVWQTRDFAEKYSANGLSAYTEGLEFADRIGIPIGIAFAILAGVTNFSAVKDAFEGGSFRVKDRAWAESVASLYAPLLGLSAARHNVNLLAACMAACRVPEFEAKRLLQNAERRRDLLVPYSTREAYLDMLEEIYNFGRSKLFGLKAAATMAMRDRNAVVAKKAAKQARQAAVA